MIDGRKPVEKVLDALGDANPTSSGWICRCPAHEDDRPSLSVSVGDDGRVLMHCFAGCKVEAVVNALGLAMRDLYPASAEHNRPATPTAKSSAKRHTPIKSGKTFSTAADAVADMQRRNGKASAVWEYHDAAGALAGLVLRWNLPDGSKDIRPVSLYADGWRVAAMHTPRPLYKLPDLAAVEVVQVHEGEKAADAACALGYTATTSAGGSSAASKTDWKPLAGKTVLLFPDNDMPGKGHIARVNEILSNLTPPAWVKTVRLPGLPDKGDIADWVAARPGASNEQLKAELDAIIAAAETVDTSLSSPLPSRVPGNPPATDPPRNWPAFPVAEAYHGVAGEIVRTLDPFSEADPFAVLMQLLLLFGNSIGRGPYYQVGGDRHYTNEFAVLVGPTGGGRKGTSAGMARLAFAGADDDWLNGRNVGGVSSGEGLLWAVRDPIIKRERANSGRSTPPTFADVEADPGVSDKRLMVEEPEFASVLKQTERQGNTASAVLRQLWDGRPVVQTLTKNNPAKATGAHVSLIGHVTEEELHRYLTATETANGFANRFMFACVRRSKLLPDGGQVPDSMLAPLRDRLASAITYARSVGEVRRHASASALWHAVYPLLTFERGGLSGALSARAAPHVLRLAMLFVLLDRSAIIYPVHLLAGVAVWDYCERSASFLFGGRTGNPVADEIRDLLRAAPNGLTRTELVAALGRHQHGDKLTAALVALEGAGLASPEKVATGGKPAERWRAANRANATSPLMDTARRVYASLMPCDISDERDQTLSAGVQPSHLVAKVALVAPAETDQRQP